MSQIEYKYLNYEPKECKDIIKKLNDAYYTFSDFFNANQTSNISSSGRRKKPRITGYYLYALLFIIDHFFGKLGIFKNLTYEDNNGDPVNKIIYKETEIEVKFSFSSDNMYYFNVMDEVQYKNLSLNEVLLQNNKNFNLNDMLSIYYPYINVNSRDLLNGVYEYFVTGIHLYYYIASYISTLNENKPIEMTIRKYKKFFSSKFKTPLIFENQSSLNKLKIEKGLEWFDNSCYLDTILVMILFSTGTYFRYNIFNTKFNENLYKGILVNTFCDKDSDYKDIKNIKEFRNEIKTQLVDIFVNVIKNTKDKNVKCTNIRNILGKCKSGISSRDIFSSTVLYDVIANVFADLKLRLKTPNILNDLKYKNYIDLSDYLEGKLDYFGGNNSIIVFSNDVYDNYSYINKNMNKINNNNQKEVLDEVIEINKDRYILIGLIINENEMHYVMYFKPLWDSTNFYYYDDTSDGGKIEKLSKGDYKSRKASIFFKNKYNIYDKSEDEEQQPPRLESVPELFFYKKI